MDLFTKNQQYLCVGASLYFSSYFFVEECTEDKDANEGGGKQGSGGENAGVDEGDQDEWMEM